MAPKYSRFLRSPWCLLLGAVLLLAGVYGFDLYVVTPSVTPGERPLRLSSLLSADLPIAIRSSRDGAELVAPADSDLHGKVMRMVDQLCRPSTRDRQSVQSLRHKGIEYLTFSQNGAVRFRMYGGGLVFVPATRRGFQSYRAERPEAFSELRMLARGGTQP